VPFPIYLESLAKAKQGAKLKAKLRAKLRAKLWAQLRPPSPRGMNSNRIDDEVKLHIVIYGGNNQF
jgi:hypothetical protein